MTALRHYMIPPNRWPLDVLVIGCGGNGAQILTGLASLDLALRELGERSLSVTTVDPDTVSTANLGRQPFFPCDVGRHKALVLTERINIAYGLNWTASTGRVTAASDLGYDLVVSCVDTAAARRAIGAAIAKQRRLRPTYWLDLGNRTNTGQIVLGQVDNAFRNFTFEQPRLPTVLDVFPELKNDKLAEDDTPSCSLAEALEKQSLFINRTLASHALAMLFELFGRGSISHAGLYLNLANGLATAMPLPQPAPKPARRRRPAAKRARDAAHA